MADVAAQVMAAAKEGFAEYRRQQNQSAREEGTFVAGFMAGYLMGFSHGLEEDVLARAVARMLQTRTEAIVVAHEARSYTLSVKPA